MNHLLSGGISPSSGIDCLKESSFQFGRRKCFGAGNETVLCDKSFGFGFLLDTNWLVNDCKVKLCVKPNTFCYQRKLYHLDLCDVYWGLQQFGINKVL